MAAAAAALINSSSNILKAAVHTNRTNVAYKKALHLFLSYCVDEGIDDSVLGTTSIGVGVVNGTEVQYQSQLILLDNTVSEYIEQLYCNGGKLYQANNLLHALHFYLPNSRGHLLNTALTVKGWNKIHLRTKVHRLPLTLELTMVIAVSMIMLIMYVVLLQHY